MSYDIKIHCIVLVFSVLAMCIYIHIGGITCPCVSRYFLRRDLTTPNHALNTEGAAGSIGHMSHNIHMYMYMYYIHTHVYTQ